ncbi:MAG: hypothetical protein ACE5HV_03810 [Acidobacteriota bacterium]
MGKINMGRVILGGLLAGLVMNIGETLLNTVIVGEEFEAATEALGLPPVGGSAIAIFVIMGFALGCAMVWLYAAIRPRFGAGPKTAICAGLLIWSFVYLYAGIGWMAMGLFPSSLIMVSILWGLFEVPISAVAGAWLYKEE